MGPTVRATGQSFVISPASAPQTVAELIGAAGKEKRLVFFEITGFLHPADRSYPQVGIKLGKPLTPV